ncbi:MAG: hypothetical protein IJ499_01040 [Clostridia bacterium]|nr:hypothetical protein [Clostridia bacterium]
MLIKVNAPPVIRSEKDIAKLNGWLFELTEILNLTFCSLGEENLRSELRSKIEGRSSDKWNTQ